MNKKNNHLSFKVMAQYVPAIGNGFSGVSATATPALLFSMLFKAEYSDQPTPFLASTFKK